MPPFGSFMMSGDQAFGAGPDGPSNQGPMQPGNMGMLGMQDVQISSAYNSTVTSILNNDTDVKNLVAQGYNVTGIHPIIQSVIAGDGTVTTEATTAIVTMQNGTTGFATVTVDITNAKVTQIVNITRTVIDK